MEELIHFFDFKDRIRFDLEYQGTNLMMIFFNESRTTQTTNNYRKIKKNTNPLGLVQ